MSRSAYAKLLIVACFLFLFFTRNNLYVFAETRITTEEITVDTEWSKEAGPYIINGPLVIQTGVTLNILPGTVVKFDHPSESGIIVDGTLHAVGLPESKIYFTSTDGRSPRGDEGWLIAFEPGSENSTFSYVNIQYAFGLFFESTKNNLDHIEISHSVNGISSYDSILSLTAYHAVDILADAFTGYKESTLFLKDAEIETLKENEAIGAYEDTDISLENLKIKDVWQNNAIALFNSTASIKNTTISDTFDYVGAIGVFGSKAYIKNAALSDGAGFGLEISGQWQWQTGNYLPSEVTVEDSSMSNYEDSGIFIYSPSDSPVSHVSVRGSRLQGNLWAGITGLFSTGLSIVDSTIQKNGIFGVYEYGGKIIAENNFWGDSSGPYQETANPEGLGDELYGNVDFEPWLTDDPLQKATGTAVIFIPGLKASRLYKKGFLSENQLWTPNRNADVEKLYMDANGKSVDQSVYTRDVVDEVFGFNIYKGFLNSLNKMKGEGTIKGWKALPYDWRDNIFDIVEDPIKISDSGTTTMVGEIEKLLEETKAGKITIITHSNGGLVAKVLVQRLQELKTAGKSDLLDKIDKVIMVAAPQLGTPTTIPSLLHGDGEDIPIILNKQIPKQLGENMPGAYSLLPSERYFQEVSDPVITFDPSVSAILNTTGYGSEIDSFDELQKFLLAINDKREKPIKEDLVNPNILNSKLLSGAKTIHEKIDNWNFPSGIKVSEVIGWGLDTVKGIRYFATTSCVEVSSGGCQDKLILDHKPLFTSEGDKTVVTSSADISDRNKYYIDILKTNKGFKIDRKHSDILEIDSVQELIKFIITGTNIVPPFISLVKPQLDQESKKIRLAVHSPVDLHIYDKEGNHTGLITNPNPLSDLILYEEAVPNSYYIEMGEGKYAGFEENDNTVVNLKGLGLGTFTFEAEEFKGQEKISGIIFADIPVTSQTKAEISFNNFSTTTSLKLDVEGDGIYETTIKPNTELEPMLFLEMMKGVVKTLGLPKNTLEQIIQKIDKIIKSLSKEKIKVAKLKIVAFSKQLGSRKWKYGKITQQDKDIMLKMIDQLLASLN